MDIYWNHYTAFHEVLVADSKIRGGRVLDIGCGNGLLLQHLAPFAQQVVGIDTDTGSDMNINSSFLRKVGTKLEMSKEQ